MDALLRDLPARRAPPSLEARVYSELESRAGRPWWRQRFAHWPLAARASFVLICSVIIAATFVFTDESWWTGTAQLANAAVTATTPWMRPAFTVLGSASELAALVARWLPPAWLPSLVIAAALLYAALFALIAAVYRTLYRPASPIGHLS